MSIKIYTKVGDKGITSLIGGAKVSKADLRIEAYGTVDELNSYVGLCHDLIENETLKSSLTSIQDRLFTIGSQLACEPGKEIKMQLPELIEEDVLRLEEEIDKMNEELPPMKNFILPGGHQTVSHLHIARCICRRAERCCVRIDSEQSTEKENLVIKYLNRLSDYLFILSRYVANKLNVPEKPWLP